MAWFMTRVHSTSSIADWQRSCLRKSMTTYYGQSAYLSPDGVFRYWLLRQIAPGEKTAIIIGVNPSTADGETDDPTIRRSVDFARQWGCSRLAMINLHAFRSPDPKALLSAVDPVGPENGAVVRAFVEGADIVVAAWGQSRLHPIARQIGGWILSRPTTQCLGQNKDGSPKHPLYLRATTQLRGIQTP